MHVPTSQLFIACLFWHTVESLTNTISWLERHPNKRLSKAQKEKPLDCAIRAGHTDKSDIGSDIVMVHIEAGTREWTKIKKPKEEP